MTAIQQGENFFWSKTGVEQCSCGTGFHARDTIEGYKCPECGKRSEYVILSASTLEYERIFMTVGDDMAKRLHQEKQMRESLTMRMAGVLYLQGLGQ